jgi:hypothetical protein
MLSPVIPAEEWAERYKIELTGEHLKCRKCGEPLKLEIPFAQGTFRGLSTEAHYPCGEEFRQHVFITTDKEFNEWAAKKATASD